MTKSLQDQHSTPHHARQSPRDLEDKTLLSCAVSTNANPTALDTYPLLKQYRIRILEIEKAHVVEPTDLKAVIASKLEHTNQASKESINQDHKAAVISPVTSTTFL